MSKPLFDRLGGRNGISTIVYDTVENHMNNTNVNARFLPFKDKPEQLAIIKNHTIDFFVAGSGGPNVYFGKDMVTAHAGMFINPAEYRSVIDDIFSASDKNAMNEDTKKDVLANLWSNRGMIKSK